MTTTHYPPGYCRAFWDLVTAMYQHLWRHEPFSLDTLQAHIDGCDQCATFHAQEQPRVREGE